MAFDPHLAVTADLMPIYKCSTRSAFRLRTGGVSQNEGITNNSSEKKPDFGLGVEQQEADYRDAIGNLRASFLLDDPRGLGFTLSERQVISFARRKAM